MATSVTPYYREEGIPILRNLNIKENYLDDTDILYLDKTYADSQVSKHIHAGDVLTVHTGYIGTSCIVPEKYDECLTFTTLITTTDNKVLEGEYLAQYLNSEIGMNAVQAVTTQGGRQNLNTNDFEKVNIRYPSIAEQRKIVRLLRSVDNLITLHQRKCDELKNYKKGLLQNMFPQPGETSPRVRFPDFTAPWEQRKLGDVFQEYSEKNHEELPALTIIQGKGTILREESDRNLQYDKSSLSGYKLVRQDDFIVHLRSFEGGLEKANTDGIISPAYHTFHGDNTDTRFYYPFFRSRQFIDVLLKPHVYGIRDGKSIDINGMKTIVIPVPSYKEQRVIGDFLESLDDAITLHQRKCDELKNYKKGLLQNMFPQPGETSPRVRFPDFTAPWEQRKFGDIAQRQSETKVSDDANPCIEYEDIITESGLLNKDVYSKDARKNGIRFTPSDVLYGKLRPYLHNWFNPDFAGVAVGDWWVLRPVDSDKQFLYRLIQTTQYDDAANQSSGTKMPRADWKLVSNTVFSIPASKDEQSKIAALFNALDNTITLHQRKCDELKNYKKGLLQKMFI